MKDNRAVPGESMGWIYLWTGRKDEAKNQLNIENLCDVQPVSSLIVEKPKYFCLNTTVQYYVKSLVSFKCLQPSDMTKMQYAFYLLLFHYL